MVLVDEQPVRAADEAGHELVELSVHDIVMGPLPGVPQLEPRLEQVSGDEHRQPLRPREPRCRDVLPGESADSTKTEMPK